MGDACNQDHHFGDYIRIHLVLISLASLASFAVQLLDLGLIQSAPAEDANSAYKIFN
jgi:hypothetical protein